ncbi:adenylate kinase family protein [Kitasatospora sp. NPDC101157]|uniref:adenylate kinase family protein n=1 Tax=Kitasatospora sp. NPDC101157 TaxID=3364098 RepID=UPI003807B9A1
MRVVLLQPPAWRAGPPAGTLAEALAVPRIVFGDLIRAHLAQGTELGIRCAEAIRSGGPFPDLLATAVARDHLRRAAPAAFLLVGHPLNTAQALALDEVLLELGTPLDAALFLRLSAGETECRIRRQAACSPWGGGPVLYRREDDSEERVRGRLRAYEAMVQPVIRHYAAQGLLATVDAAGTHDDIAGRALGALGRD